MLHFLNQNSSHLVVV